MSTVHHEPDLTTTPCVACGAPIVAADLEKDEHHQGRSCCTWHPYHRACVIAPDGVPARADRCVTCGDVIPPSTLFASLEWLASRVQRVHEPAPGAAPIGWRLIRGPWKQRSIELSTGLNQHLAGTPQQLTSSWWKLLMRFAPVHRECVLHA